MWRAASARRLTCNRSPTDVVFENSANSTWNGGASTATPLGDISSTSSQALVDELIGEWFLGTSLPSLSVASVGGGRISARPTKIRRLPLYGATGGSDP